MGISPRGLVGGIVRGARRRRDVDVREDDRDVEVSFELAYRVIGMRSFVGGVPGVLDQLDGAHADEGLILHD
jgi:hypothetical protein